MTHKIVVLILIVILFLSLVASKVIVDLINTQKPLPEDIYIGVTADGNVTSTKKVMDKIKNYANLVLINNPDLIKNITRLEEVCDYAHQADLSFFIHMSHPSYWKFNYNPIEWLSKAEDKYGEHFQGIYLYDEPGGNQLDLGPFREFDETTMPYDYRDAANTYVYYLYVQIRDFIKIDKIVTSDYGLFWFDYEAGYDTIFCEFGNHRIKEINIPLCRGAAELHNKTWGVMITWSHESLPYIYSSDELYDDMIDAYRAGATYIAVFNYPEIGEYGLLSEDHFRAIELFSEYVSNTPRNRTSNVKKIAYVLPKNYGWGIRNPTDKIWGVWEADEKSSSIWTSLNEFVELNGYDFDIVYDSLWTKTFAKQHYDQLIWWNGTIQNLN